jgi:hypothetical protein
MTTDFEITDKELREVYKLLTKEQLIEALIRKHKECRDIANKGDYRTEYKRLRAIAEKRIEEVSNEIRNKHFNILLNQNIEPNKFYCNDEIHYPSIGRCEKECEMCKEQRLK